MKKWRLKLSRALAIAILGCTLLPVVLFGGKEPARASNFGNAFVGLGFAFERFQIDFGADFSEVVDRIFDTRAARFAPKHWLGEGLGMSGPLQLLLSLEVLKRGVLPPGPGTSGSLAAGSRLALLLGLSYDGLFEVVLIEGGGGA